MTRRVALPLGVTPRLLCRAAAAEYLGISEPHFADHVAAKVPAIEIGHRKLWDRKALDRWLDERSGFAERLRPVSEWVGALDGHSHARD